MVSDARTLLEEALSYVESWEEDQRSLAEDGLVDEQWRPSDLAERIRHFLGDIAKKSGAEAGAFVHGTLSRGFEADEVFSDCHESLEAAEKHVEAMLDILIEGEAVLPPRHLKELTTGRLYELEVVVRYRPSTG